MESPSTGSSGPGGDETAKTPITFAAADQMYVSLKRLHDTGVLSDDAFDAQLKQMMIKDDTGRWWSKSRDSGDWYYSDGGDWTRGTPPTPPPSTTESSKTGGTNRETTNQSNPAYTTPPINSGTDSVSRSTTGGMINEPYVVAPATPVLANLGPRVLAYIIDAVLITVVAGVIAVLQLPQAISYLIDIGYFVYFWSTTGQTLGMQSQHIRVVRIDGTPLTWETGVLRYVGFVIGALCLLIGLLWAFWDPQRQGWHDKIAHTLVVRAAP